MEYTYTIPIDSITNEPSTITICRTDADGLVSWIPTDPANSDYQAYLASQENN